MHIILYNPLMFAFPKYVLTSRHHTTTPCRFTHGTLAQVGFTRMARVRVSQEWGDGGGWTPEWISIHLYNRFIEITTYIYNIIYNTYIYISDPYIYIYIYLSDPFFELLLCKKPKRPVRQQQNSRATWNSGVERFQQVMRHDYLVGGFKDFFYVP